MQMLGQILGQNETYIYIFAPPPLFKKRSRATGGRREGDGNK